MSHRLFIQGEHRTWLIENIGRHWCVSTDPAMAPANPGSPLINNINVPNFLDSRVLDDLTDAYDAYVAAEYADNGEHAE